MLSAPEAVVERRITVRRRQQLSFFCVCYSGVARHGHWRRQCSFEEATAKTILMGEHLHPHCQPLNEKGEKWLFASSSRRWPLFLRGKNGSFGCQDTHTHKCGMCLQGNPPSLCCSCTCRSTDQITRRTLPVFWQKNDFFSALASLMSFEAIM